MYQHQGVLSWHMHALQVCALKRSLCWCCAATPPRELGLLWLRALNRCDHRICDEGVSVYTVMQQHELENRRRGLVCRYSSHARV
jgi:hypothetical protein